MYMQSAARVMSLRARLLGARSVASGAILYIGMRWFDRALGVISTLILARLLVPDDFGIVAIATIVLGFLSAIFDVGLNVRLVQMGELDRVDIDTAWTLQLLRNLFLAALLFVLAPEIAAYFADPRLSPVMQWMALGIVISGANSMAPTLFQKRREYAREVSYFMARRFVAFVTTVALALWLRNYWAMVFGSLVATAFGCVLSYWMMPGLRTPTLRKWRHFLGATVWLTFRSIGEYASLQIDKLLVGRIGGVGSLGSYSLADQIAALPTNELLAPLGRAVFPAFAQAKDDPTRLGSAVHLMFGVQVLIALPASVGLALCSNELVLALLGEKWLAAAPILVLLAIGYGFNSLNTGFFYLLLALGRFRLQAALAWISLLFWSGVLIAASEVLDAPWVATARMILSGGFSVVLFLVTLLSTSAVTFRGCLAQSWRQFLATALMAAAVTGAGAAAAPAGIWGMLVVKVLTGVIVYIVAILLLWRMAGYPAGAEQWSLNFLRKLIGRSS